MKTDNNKKETYCTPEIISVQLDNEISLVLATMPPQGPGEAYYNPEYFEDEHFFIEE